MVSQRGVGTGPARGGRSSARGPSTSTSGSDELTTTRKTTTYWVDGKNGKLPWPWYKVAAPAALAAAVFVGGSTAWAVPHIESTLTEATLADLEAQGIDTSTLDVDYSYRNGTITGTAPAGVDVDDIEAAVNDDGIRKLDIELTAPPEPSPEPEPEPAEETEPVEEVAPETGPSSVTAEVATDGVVLTGTVATEAQRATLVDAAVERFGAANVDDRIEVSGLDEAVPGVDDRVSFLAGVLADLPDGVVGTATVEDDGYALSWSAPDAAIAGTLETAAAAAPADYAGTVAVDVPEAPVLAVDEQTAALQDEFDALEAEIRETIVFDTSDETLSAQAQATLDKVVAVMTTYDLPLVEVAGHTDSRGNDDANQALSERRAQSVVDYIVSQGIPGERISARGAGEAEPIADNGTEAGQAENRRVDLVAEAP